MTCTDVHTEARKRHWSLPALTPEEQAQRLGRSTWDTPVHFNGHMSADGCLTITEQLPGKDGHKRTSITLTPEATRALALQLTTYLINN